MAQPSAPQNPTGEPTAPVVDTPPQADDQTRNQNADAAAPKVKTEKELERERRKAEKAKKFAEKKAKAAAKPAPAPKAEKKEKKVEKEKTTDAYDPKVIETGRYEWWEERGLFKPEFGSDNKVKPEGYFVIPIPPPNVTGSLHMGHALTNALQDTMIRWQRMKGKTTLWLPGMDHAGISTQSVVEKMLWKKEKKTRHDLGREVFTDRVWEWKHEYHANIKNALRRVGGSFDWSREAFTMDPNLSAAVTETFVRLHEEGIIYRANRLVNWCVALNTSLSNLEVENKEVEGRTLLDVPGYEKKVEFGVLTHFCYEIDGTKERIEIATTRPETMIGDTGIAVHPEDKRYQQLIGKFAKHPFVDRLLPIVADTDVDPEFGTGAVKITPAHDFNDFNRGKAHNLEFISVMNDDGTFNKNGGIFAGMKRFDARYKVIELLKEKGLYVKWEHNPMKIPRCAKSNDVIEPILKPQWWMKMESLAKPAIEAVEKGDIVIKPESAEKNYFRWMRNINDWCLSRQLWWGHQAPAYFVKIEGEENDDSDGNLWVSGRTEEEARKKAEVKFPGKKFDLVRDPDVLDTWFSSGLWPFSTLGWPNKTHDLENLYPTSVLETGWDILFFWVARMIMLGIKLTGQVPFREVYCHSLIRDSEGRKMSKSLGNVIDPIDVMEGIQLQTLHDKLLLGNLAEKEVATATKYQKKAFPKGIPECGADALRFALVSYTTGGGDIAFDIQVIHGYRRFCNKIYQATKYVLGKLGDDFKPQPAVSKTGRESLSERWILHKFNSAAKEINEALEQREFNVVATTVYQYWYAQLCDVFIENSKFLLAPEVPAEVQESAKQTLYTALEGALALIHPIMPFVTEELWQRLPRRPNDNTISIMKARYPEYKAEFNDPEAEAAYELILKTSGAIRSILSQYEVKTKGDIIIQTYDATSHKTLSDELTSVKSLGGKFLGDLSIQGPETTTRPSGCVVSAVGSEAAVFLRVSKEVALEQEEKAKASLEKARAVVTRQTNLMSSAAWKEKAKPEVREMEEKKLKDAESETARLEEQIREFEKLRILWEADCIVEMDVLRIKPKNPRTARILKAKEPQLIEGAKRTLLLHGSKCPTPLHTVLKTLHSLTRPNSLLFHKKNENIRPFESAESLEFLADKNDCGMVVFGSSNKKRPNCVTMARVFNAKLLDMCELLLLPSPDGDQIPSMNNLTMNVGMGLRPLLLFSGTPWDDPTSSVHVMLKSMFMDMFKGETTDKIDVEGLQYALMVAAEEPTEGLSPVIHLRWYKIKTKRSGHKLPRVELEEIGPKFDFKVGRIQEAPRDVMKEAMKQGKRPNEEIKMKKNIGMDSIGDKIGRVHLTKQDLGGLQTRKMKGLKRRAGMESDEEDADMMDVDEVSEDEGRKRAKTA
ncbi:valyl-tRNA synthetase mitochondrial precursor [Aspergillus pseudotamarii]|uniref:valine--tRNA ligase n=1 Tax=Aspergillus pseudotamarii TaxID=132259 RepID=A0A5N6T3Y1_ASPPS|nr:valyl-tRNA synthetase mitochondrial precursor [Aspergillus pseudotamarii]KAE8141010.1 valyl-tRNA synthetase mitochondrial precursor [Aspergillus pseudotamarii]